MEIFSLEALRAILPIRPDLADTERDDSFLDHIARLQERMKEEDRLVRERSPRTDPIDDAEAQPPTPRPDLHPPAEETAAATGSEDQNGVAVTDNAPPDAPRETVDAGPQDGSTPAPQAPAQDQAANPDSDMAGSPQTAAQATDAPSANTAATTPVAPTAPPNPAAPVAEATKKTDTGQTPTQTSTATPTATAPTGTGTSTPDSTSTVQATATRTPPETQIQVSAAGNPETVGTPPASGTAAASGQAPGADPSAAMAGPDAQTAAAAAATTSTGSQTPSTPLPWDAPLIPDLELVDAPPPLTAGNPVAVGANAAKNGKGLAWAATTGSANAKKHGLFAKLEGMAAQPPTPPGLANAGKIDPATLAAPFRAELSGQATASSAGEAITVTTDGLPAIGAKPAIALAKAHSHQIATRNPAVAARATQQISVQIVQSVKAGVDQVQVRLDPPELGRVDVKMQVSDAGRVAAVISVERPETLEMLQRDSRALERALADAGLETDENGLNFHLQGQGNDGEALAGGSGSDADGSSSEGEAAAAAAVTATMRMSVHDGALDISV